MVATRLPRPQCVASGRHGIKASPFMLGKYLEGMEPSGGCAAYFFVGIKGRNSAMDYALQ